MSDGDPHALSKDLDVASFDYYVGGGHLNAAHEATRLDWVRGLKRQNFWLMETQAGSTNFSADQQSSRSRRNAAPHLECNRLRRRRRALLAVAPVLRRP
jgi:beta-galactosidase GanA